MFLDTQWGDVHLWSGSTTDSFKRACLTATEGLGEGSRKVTMTLKVSSLRRLEREEVQTTQR